MSLGSVAVPALPWPARMCVQRGGLVIVPAGLLHASLGRPCPVGFAGRLVLVQAACQLHAWA